MYPNRRTRPSQPNPTTPRQPIVNLDQLPRAASPQHSPTATISGRPSDGPLARTQSPRYGRHDQPRNNTSTSPSPQPHRGEGPSQNLNAGLPQLSPHTQNTGQSPGEVSRQTSPPRPVTNNTQLAVLGPELRLFVKNLPPGCGTLQIYRLLKRFGTLDRIEIQEPRRDDMTNAWITFRPAPKRTEWIRDGLDLIGDNGLARRHIVLELTVPKTPYRHRSPLNPTRTFAEEIAVAAEQLVFGVMEMQDSMLDLRRVNSSPSAEIAIAMNLHRKCLDVDFAFCTHPLASDDAQTAGQLHRFKMRLSLTQIVRAVVMVQQQTGQKALVLKMGMPPLLFRKTQNIESTHESGTTLWSEWQTWYRQTGIEHDSPAVRKASTQLQREASIVDIGRWLTYRLTFSQATATSPAFAELCEALRHHNIEIEKKLITFDTNHKELLWNWLDDPAKLIDGSSSSSAPSFELQAMAKETIHLPFDVRYQLEACISLGILHECNVGKEFLQKLANMEPRRVTKLLEKVADEKERFYCPKDIFRRLLGKVNIIHKSIPSYCAIVRSAIVTPTTVYFLPPVVETSNSIIRKYQKHQEQFLRVKFTDEKYKGKIMSPDDDSMNEVFTRVKRTLTNGINVGGRHHDFLAFSSSQIRECSAYFFAPVDDITAEKIRGLMGMFGEIDVVAKYCARVGQSLSTTRATQYKVRIERIQDIKRNDYCFTDGVGKISPFLAQVIAQEHGLPNSMNDYPSVFQFRMGGCKGVLAVDPCLKANTVQIRLSQEKFKVLEEYPGLNICRISQFTAANLNVQVILVLSALGVDDNVFLVRMRHMLSDLQQAMHDENKAMELLQRNIDFNQMTLQLASMLLDGFMETKDPFTISCLHLWRSWSLKYLKEKARIYIEHGAFVFGCVDETATLRGHFDADMNGQDATSGSTPLPEIFIQLPDPDSKGKWRVIEGICVVARNPSLHPGDVRVVKAVDVPQLRHLRNCVVFPQTGDRDLPNMCSGGDLDGDDYLVMWDVDLIPEEWNYPAMNYEAPPAKKSEGPVTVDDMTSFFVTHMKHANVSRIAVAHRYWADALPDGIKDPKCLELAELHSMAVDYTKTGVPAHMPKRLRVTRWPHWSEVKNRSQSKIYHSNKVLGKLYDMVKRVDFVPAWHLAFDERILRAYDLDDQLLEAARDVKEIYDDAIKGIMNKYSIKTECEAWTTFVLEHCDDMSDYKFAETIGEAINALKDQHKKLCYEKAGTTDQERDWSKMGPFIAAMYTVTAQQVAAEMEQCKKFKLVRGQYVPAKIPSVDNMPFMSFPWLFPAELGRIATGRAAPFNPFPQPLRKSGTAADMSSHGGIMHLNPLPEVVMSEQSVLYGQLDGGIGENPSVEDKYGLRNEEEQQVADAEPDDIMRADFSDGSEHPDKSKRVASLDPKGKVDEVMEHLRNDRVDADAVPTHAVSDLAIRNPSSAVTEDAEGDDDEQEAEVITITLENSPLNELEKLMGL